MGKKFRQMVKPYMKENIFDLGFSYIKEYISHGSDIFIKNIDHPRPVRIMGQLYPHNQPKIMG